MQATKSTGKKGGQKAHMTCNGQSQHQQKHHQQQQQQQQPSRHQHHHHHHHHHQAHQTGLEVQTSKSVAQRVMDVATGEPVAARQTTTTTTTTTSSNNSVENDHEVETITSRLARVTGSISPVESQTSSSASNKHTAAGGQQARGPRSGSSPSLVLGQQDSAGGPQSSAASVRISLDTRVPHPHEGPPLLGACGAGHTGPRAGPGGPAPAEEEVSYYNDAPLRAPGPQQQQQQQREPASQLEPEQVGGSLDNNTKPRLLLLAAASGAMAFDQRSLGNGACHQLGAASWQQLRGQDGVQQRQQQQLPLAPAGALEQDPAQSHHYDDVTYDLRYDNALVMEKEAAKLLHRRELSAGAASSARYQEIPDLPFNQGQGHGLGHDPGEPGERELALPGANAEDARDKSLTDEQHSTTCQHSTSAVSIQAASPKAKSAPATPCNVTTPLHTAFHLNSGQHAGQFQNPNTMPPDMRRNISANTCRVLPAPAPVPASVPSERRLDPQQRELAQQRCLERAELALTRDKDYRQAIKLFTQCLSLAADGQPDKGQLKRSFKVYARRAEAHFQLGQFHEAIDDSMAARQLNPKWTQAYYLQGRAQFLIGRYADSLAVFSFGLTQEPSAQRGGSLSSEPADSSATATANNNNNANGNNNNNELLFGALVEAALQSKASFRQEFEIKYNKLKALQLHTRPYLVMSVLGQELLARGHSEHAAIILESALKLSGPAGCGNSESGTSGTSSNSASSSSSNNNNNNKNSNHNGNNMPQSRKFRGSVLSSIAAAFCSLRDFDKAIAYMHKELEIERELDDVQGQCRVLSNLGYAYYKVRKFDESLRMHREQLNLALRKRLDPQACQALNAAGHVHAAKGDYSSAVQSHECCLNLTPEANAYAQFKELLSLGHLHALSNNLKGAEDKYNQASELLKSAAASDQLGAEQLTDGTIMVNFNLAYLALKRQTRDSYQKAKFHYTSVIEAAQALADGGGGGAGGSGASSGTSNKRRLHKRATYEMRAYHGLGQTCRLLKELGEARNWFEKQLRLAQTLKNLVGQSQALCNLGLVSQQQQQAPHEQQTSWRLFEENLKLVETNPLLKAYAHSYMGLAYSRMGRLRESRDHYETSLDLFRKLGYCAAEQKTIEENIASIQKRTGQADPFLGAANNGVTNHKKVMMAA